ncbi:hypothetical protein FRC17_000770 [Serendipita sp. 399]|nr:hypothetical protein FRC17_000770 [Serendipita sp. 399]
MFSTQLSALVAIATAIYSVQAKSVSLASRQLTPAIPGIPVPCQPVCIVFTTLQQSITPTQLCTAANSANIGRCAQCVMTMNTSSVVGNAELMTQLQNAVNSFTSACAAARLPVPPITLLNPLTQQPLLGNGALPTPGVPLPGAPPTNVVAPPGAVETRADVKVMGTHSVPMTPAGALPGAQFAAGQPPVGTPFPPGTPIPPPGTGLPPTGQQIPPAQGVVGAPPAAIPGIANFRQQQEQALLREQEIQQARARARAASVANFEREREEAFQRQAGIASFEREEEALRREQQLKQLQREEQIRREEQAGIASREQFGRFQGGRPVKRSLPNNPVALLRRFQQQSPSSASAPSSPKGNGAIGRMDTKNVGSMMILVAVGLLASWIV